MGHSVRILGVDPGSLKTGFGVIEQRGTKLAYVASGVIRIPSVEMPERLRLICTQLGEVVSEYGPDEMAVEDIFLARDARAALKLGQARGAAIVAGVLNSLPVSEYAARLVKQSVVGNGNANKDQVQFMIKQLFGLNAVPQEDAADALAVAVTHAHCRTQKSVS